MSSQRMHAIRLARRLGTLTNANAARRGIHSQVLSELAGQVHLEFEGGGVVSGAFNARRLSLQVLCG